MTEAEVADLTHMLSLRGVLPQPGYTDKPARRPANKAGGGRSQRKTMRGGGEISATTSGPSALPVTGEDEALMSDDDYCPLRGEEVSKEQMQLLAELKAEEREEQLRAATARFEEENGLVEASFNPKKKFGHRNGRSSCAHSIGKIFLCYMVLFSFETSATGSPGNYLYIRM